jgi:hypothetical protein
MDCPRVIAVTAPSRRSGKGTITDVLVGEYGYTELMFAMPLKVMYIALLMYQGVDQAHYPKILDGYLKETPMDEVGGLSLRTFAEGVGTDWGRKMVDPFLWVNMAKFKIKKMLDLGHRLVLSDVRFANECDIARQHGGQVWSVVRPTENGGHEPTLSSEGHLKFYTFDAVFANAGTVDDLKDHVRGYMA